MMRAIQFSMGSIEEAAIAEADRDKTCIILEHEDVATRLTNTFLVCPYNYGKAEDFQNDLN